MLRNIVSETEIVKASGMTIARVKNLLADTSPAVVLGRQKGYYLSDVQDVIWEAHKGLLVFLGLPATRTASYDVSVASEGDV